VADYAAELLPALVRLAEVRVVAAPDGDGPRPNETFAGCAVVAPSHVPDGDEVQLVHLGNNPYHSWLIDRLGLPRTSVVLHDAVLHHLLVEATLAGGDRQRFEGLLLEAHPNAEALARARAEGVDGRRDPFLFPARRVFLQGVRGVLVHSNWAAEQVNRDLPELPVARLCLSVADPGAVDRAAMREFVGAAPDEVVVMHLGFLTPDKGLGELVGALAGVLRTGVRARLVVVGEGASRAVLQEAAEALEVSQAVTFSGWLDSEHLVRVPAAADLGVVLRSPSAGETSAAALRFLACGTPVAVTGVRQFLEWPESAAPRVTPGPSAMADLARLIAAASSGGAWQRRREAARAAYQAGHRPEQAAEQMIRALASFA
jgi:glycosyltransferase involved in cell wall biosynthesis